jgi:hypothetical protein
MITSRPAGLVARRRHYPRPARPRRAALLSVGPLHTPPAAAAAPAPRPSAPARPAPTAPAHATSPWRRCRPRRSGARCSSQRNPARASRSRTAAREAQHLRAARRLPHDASPSAPACAASPSRRCGSLPRAAPRRRLGRVGTHGRAAPGQHADEPAQLEQLELLEHGVLGGEFAAWWSRHIVSAHAQAQSHSSFKKCARGAA